MANEFPLPSPLPSVEPLPVAAGTPLPPPEEQPAIPPAYEPPQPVAAPPVKSSPFKLITPVIIVLVVLAVIAGLVLVGGRLLAALRPTTPSVSTKKEVTTINYWGLWETGNIMAPVITAFETANPNIKVNYQLQSQQDYQDRLQTAMTGSTPPDVARIHSTWLPVFISNLFPAPANTVSATEVQTNFYPVVANSVIVNNQVFGIPANTDGLVLFINTNLLKQASLSVPETWEDLRSLASTLTLRDSVSGKITRAGVALGNTTNVRFWPDIVTLMLMQGGINPLSPNTKTASDVLSYYVSFAAPGAFWDETQPDSILAFANEKVALVFAPLWVAPEIQAINPGLVWQTAAVPQLPDTDPINWASMWLEVVPKNAAHPAEAWKFISFLASAQAQQILFESAIKERGMAEVPTNKAVAQLASQNPISSALVSSLATAKTFYTADLTHDSATALNSRLIKYLEDAVNATAKKQDATKVVDTLNRGFNQILSAYRLVNPLPTPTPQ